MRFRPAFRHKRRVHHRSRSSGRKKPLPLRSRLRTKPIVVNRQSPAPLSVRATRDPKGRVKFIPLRSRLQNVAIRDFLALPKRIKAAASIRSIVGVDNIPLTPADHAHCIKRLARRAALFSLRIAGKNKRNSPGSGGTYKRTEESKMGC